MRRASWSSDSHSGLSGGVSVAVLGEHVQLDQPVPRAKVHGEVPTLWRVSRS